MTLVRTRRIIDDAGADAVIAAAEEYANAHGHRVVIAVVDPWGEVVAAAPHAGRADRVARASRSTRRAPPRSSSGRAARWRSRSPTAASARSRCTAPSALTGGIPLTVDGEVVGAIGTSGETPDEDEADLDRRRRRRVLDRRRSPALTYEGARIAAEAAGAAAAERGVAPVDLRGRRRRRARCTSCAPTPPRSRASR